MHICSIICVEIFYLCERKKKERNHGAFVHLLYNFCNAVAGSSLGCDCVEFALLDLVSRFSMLVFWLLLFDLVFWLPLLEFVFWLLLLDFVFWLLLLDFVSRF